MIPGSPGKSTRIHEEFYEKMQQRYKQDYDAVIVKETYEKGDLVYLWQTTVPRKGSKNLAQTWRGSCWVRERINELKILLGIPRAKGESTIRVHINILRKTNARILEVSPIEANPLHQNLPEGY